MIPEDVQQRYRATGAWGAETLVDRFEAVCSANAERTALIEAATRHTFATVARLTARLSGHFARAGVGAGDIVSWQLPNWWEAAIVHHAALRVGAIPNPLNPAFRAREMRFIIDEAKPSVLVVPREWRGFDHLALAQELGVPRIIVARGDGDGSLSRLLEADTEVPAPFAPNSASCGLLLYTSGTTGDPKGVMHSHRALLCEMETFRLIHALTTRDRYLGGAPVAHIAGLVYGLLLPFALGTSTVLLERWDPRAAIEAIARERATFMTGPPTFLQTLAGEPSAANADLSSFRLFSTGGASVSTELVRAAGARLGCTVKRAYGSTEVPTLTATTLDDDERARLETDGRAIGEAEIRIVDGEIWARAPEMLIGYRNGDTSSFAGEGWFRTGDLGAVDADGLLRVTGRLKDIIIRGGENISAKEIEDLLAQHPSVSDVAVVGIPDERLGERVCAFVAIREGARLSFDEMVAFLRAHDLATHKLPERLEVRTSLPKTESGKIRKQALREELSQA